MSSVREESPAAKTDDGDVSVPRRTLEDAIAELVALAVDVLRALNGTGPTRIKVSPGAATEVKIDVALHAARALRALRSALQDYVDRTPQVPATDPSAILATAALRDLLELILDRPLPLPGEDERTKPVDESALDDAVKAATVAAVALAQAADPAGTQPEDAEPTWTVRNLTPQPLNLQGRNAVWVLPAYGRRTLTRSPRLEFDLRSEEALGRVEVTEEPPPTPVDYGPLALWVFLVPIAVGVGSQQGKWGGWIGGAIAIALPLAWIFAVRVKRKERLRDVLAGLAAWALQALTFLIVLTFCLAVPAATLYYGANLEPVVSAVLDGNATSTDYLTVVCRTMQLVLISVAALLPALLYYQFDRDRLSTLRQRFEHQIFRLDPKMETIRDIDATYGRQINEIYGPERSGRSSKLPPGRRAPIFVATVLIMLGWLLVLLNPDVDVVNDEAEIAELFAPRQTAARVRLSRRVLLHVVRPPARLRAARPAPEVLQRHQRPDRGPSSSSPGCSSSCSSTTRAGSSRSRSSSGSSRRRR